MNISSSLTQDANGGAIQVFSPRTQLTGTEFSVGTSTIFSTLEDATYTINGGNSIDTKAGYIRGVPSGGYHLVFSAPVNVAFAGNAVLGLEAVITKNPKSISFFESANDVILTVEAVGDALEYSWFAKQGGEWVGVGTNSASLAIPDQSVSTDYYCSVKNSLNTVTSNVVKATRLGFETVELMSEPNFNAIGEWILVAPTGTIEITGGQLVIATGTMGQQSEARQNSMIPPLQNPIDAIRLKVDVGSMDIANSFVQVKLYSGVIGSGILEYQATTFSLIGENEHFVKIEDFIKYGENTPGDISIIEVLALAHESDSNLALNSLSATAVTIAK